MIAQELHQTGSFWSFLLSVDKDLAELRSRARMFLWRSTALC